MKNIKQEKRIKLNLYLEFEEDDKTFFTDNIQAIFKTGKVFKLENNKTLNDVFVIIKSKVNGALESL